MSYIIRRTDGVAIGTILDGTVDTSKTSLTLVGRNYANYGQIMVDNFVALLENFAYSISPTSPLTGQLWYDTSNDLLKVYTGTDFKVIGGATATPSAPVTIIAGDIWWDTLNDQLYIYNGTTPYNVAGWILVGPIYSKINGKSGAIWEQITDTTGTVHNVVSMYIDGTRQGIISEDSQFTPASAITGFTVIKPGYNMTSAGTFNGTANNASYLGGVAASNFLRTDINNTATGSLTLINDAGLTVGDSEDLTLAVSGATAQIINNTSNADIEVYTSPAGVLTRSIYINGSTGRVEVGANPTTTLGIATKQYVDGKFVDTELTGTPTAPTPSPGDNSTKIATTAFVNNSLNLNKIYADNSYVEVSDSGTTAGSIVGYVDNVEVFVATSAGMSLAQGATAHTWPQTTSNAAIATTSYVRTAAQRWDGSAKFVSTNGPDPAQGSNGDFWFQYSA